MLEPERSRRVLVVPDFQIASPAVQVGMDGIPYFSDIQNPEVYESRANNI